MKSNKEHDLDVNTTGSSIADCNQARARDCGGNCVDRSNTIGEHTARKDSEDGSKDTGIDNEERKSEFQELSEMEVEGIKESLPFSTPSSFARPPICWSDFIYTKNMRLADPKAPMRRVDQARMWKCLLLGNILDGNFTEVAYILTKGFAKRETDIGFFHLAVTEFCHHSYHMNNRAKWLKNGGYIRARHERMRELGWMLDDDDKDSIKPGTRSPLNPIYFPTLFEAELSDEAKEGLQLSRERMKDPNFPLCLDIDCTLLLNTATLCKLEEHFGNFFDKEIDHVTLRPLEAAIISGSLEIVKLLLENGAVVDRPGLYGNSPLIVAIYFHNYAIAELLIDSGADVNFVSSSSNTPLHIAASRNLPEIAALLLRNGADVNKFDSDLNSPLLLSVSKGFVRVVKVLLENGAFPTQIDPNGICPLSFALKHKCETIATLLVQHGADMQTLDLLKCHPLTLAAGAGYFALVQDMVKRGADINACSPSGRTAYLEAEMNGHTEIASWLLSQGADKVSPCIAGNSMKIKFWSSVANGDISGIEESLNKGANINSRCDNNNNTTLLLAAANGYTRVVKYLISRGAYTNCRNLDGQSPMHVAAVNGKIDILIALLEVGCSVTCVDGNGDTPLSLVAQFGEKKYFIKVAEVLLANGADINSVNFYGYSTLLCALKNEKFGHCLQIFKFLISRGADLHAKATDKSGVIHFACKFKTAEVIEFLIQSGADAEAKFWDGSTPLVDVSRESRSDLAKVLLDLGADVNTRDKRGNSPLLLAAQFDNVQLVELYLSRGADVLACDIYGRNSLMHAAKNETHACYHSKKKPAKQDVSPSLTNCRLLLLHGANVFDSSYFDVEMINASTVFTLTRDHKKKKLFHKWPLTMLLYCVSKIAATSYRPELAIAFDARAITMIGLILQSTISEYYDVGFNNYGEW